MDNFCIDVTAEGRESLRLALVLAFAHNAPGKKAIHWAEVPGVGMALLWHEDEIEYSFTSKGKLIAYQELHIRRDEVDKTKSGRVKSQKLMSPATAEAAVDLVWNWLQSLDDGQYQGSIGDSDVSEGRGFRVFCEGWGHFRNSHYTICVVSPVWAWYGK